MSVEIDRAIGFACEECGEYHYLEYSLEQGWFEDRVVNEDRIDCENCGHENHLIEEL